MAANGGNTRLDFEADGAYPSIATALILGLGFWVSRKSSLLTVRIRKQSDVGHS